jgi:drug/metabolite transporter (DMT)-like permease
MNATGTFFSVLLAHFIYQNDKLSYNKTLGCVLGFAGVMVVNLNNGLMDFSFSLMGDGFVSWRRLSSRHRRYTVSGSRKRSIRW